MERRDQRKTLRRRYKLFEREMRRSDRRIAVGLWYVGSRTDIAAAFRHRRLARQPANPAHRPSRPICWWQRRQLGCGPGSDLGPRQSRATPETPALWPRLRCCRFTSTIHIPESCVVCVCNVSYGDPASSPHLDFWAFPTITTEKSASHGVEGDLELPRRTTGNLSTLAHLGGCTSIKTDLARSAPPVLWHDDEVR